MCTHTDTNTTTTRMFCKFANLVHTVYKMTNTVVRNNGSQGIQTHWSADTQAFVVSGWEKKKKKKHPGVQAASISFSVHTNTHPASAIIDLSKSSSAD